MKHTTITQFITGTVLASFLMVATLLAVSLPAGAAPVKGPDQVCEANADGSLKNVNIAEGLDCSKGTDTQATLFEEDENNNSLFKTITNVLLFLIGAVSVIMLIIGGLRYVLSNGDSSQVTNAKNTILYAVIGIVVALLAYALVNFVVSSFTS